MCSGLFAKLKVGNRLCLNCSRYERRARSASTNFVTYIIPLIGHIQSQVFLMSLQDVIDVFLMYAELEMSRNVLPQHPDVTFRWVHWRNVFLLSSTAQDMKKIAQEALSMDELREAHRRFSNMLKKLEDLSNFLF
jgi:hypothetical protein